jgi:ribosomal protein L11 methyltransferase
MPWWQLTVQCAKDELDYTENQLLELGALSISIADAFDEPLYEPLPGEQPLWSHSKITGLFEQSLTLEQLYDELVRRLPEHQVSSIQKSLLEDQQWERVFLERYTPIAFGKNIWVCPSWHQPPDPQACNIILDPGIAFGTGSHPTTALCLEFLDQNPPLNQSVMDYGCGSGILAIAASKLGANQVSCIDIDPQALVATRENFIRNHIDPNQISIQLPDINATPEVVDYLMANILSGPLIELEPLFVKMTHSGSQLLLSGILDTQVDAIVKTYSQHFELDQVIIREQWCRVSGFKKA